MIFFQNIDGNDENHLLNKRLTTFDLYRDFLNKIKRFNDISKNNEIDMNNSMLFTRNASNTSIDNPIIRFVNNFVSRVYINDNSLNTNQNFWSTYFHYLKKFPYLYDMNQIIDDDIQSIDVEKDLFKNKNWNDIEYQINALLRDTEGLFNYYKRYLLLYDSRSYENISLKDGAKYYEQINSDVLTSSPQITYKGALKLLILHLSILCGWNPLGKMDIYDYLYNELYDFENIFKNYLEKKTIANGVKYNEIADDFASKLADFQKYNLINFNYTSFYNSYNSSKINVHSTLNNGHPIFGIDSGGSNNESIYSKLYHKFTKTYRIMRLAKSKEPDNPNTAKNVLTDDVKEIIFYGQSLSIADYSYFATIFDYYDIYDSNKQMKLIFKYTELYAESNGSLDSQIEKVYNLINKYGDYIGYNNLLHKLLIEDRLIFEENHIEKPDIPKKVCINK